MTNEGTLVLEDGSVLTGEQFGAHTSAAGEVVFNTGMVGYPETLTDPSYRGQLLVLTYPLIGNYGVPRREEDRFGLPLHFESEKIQVAGLVVSEYCLGHSHHTAVKSLHQWLEEEDIPALAGIDTRELTKKLRRQGAMLGKIELPSLECSFLDPSASDIVRSATIEAPISHRCDDVAADTSSWKPSDGHRPKVLLIDCGCKSSIIRSLLTRGLDVVRIPYDAYFLNQDYDGLLISNGPGDPSMCRATVKNVERALAVGKPILGVCLGHQILGLAVGGETYKLKFGHRGQNQPCTEIGKPAVVSTRDRPRCIITSQNHGYALRAESLPEDWNVWFTNANDSTVEGISHVSKPFLGVQFHPEATPGPVDSAWIFDEFTRLVRRGILA